MKVDIFVILNATGYSSIGAIHLLMSAFQPPIEAEGITHPEGITHYYLVTDVHAYMHMPVYIFLALSLEGVVSTPGTQVSVSNVSAQ